MYWYYAVMFMLIGVIIGMLIMFFIADNVIQKYRELINQLVRSRFDLGQRLEIDFDLVVVKRQDHPD